MAEIPPIKLYGGWAGRQGAGAGAGRTRAQESKGAGDHQDKETCFPWCELPHAQAGERHGGALLRYPVPSVTGSRLATAAAGLPAHLFFPPGLPLSFRLSIWPCGPGPQLPTGCPPGPFLCQAVSFWMVLL